MRRPWTNLSPIARLILGHVLAKIRTTKSYVQRTASFFPSNQNQSETSPIRQCPLYPRQRTFAAIVGITAKWQQQTSDLQRRLAYQPIRRPRKNPLFVVFCLILAVSPSSAELAWCSCFTNLSFDIFGSLPKPFLLRFAGGTGGRWLDIFYILLLCGTCIDDALFSEKLPVMFTSIPTR